MKRNTAAALTLLMLFALAIYGGESHVALLVIAASGLAVVVEELRELGLYTVAFGIAVATWALAVTSYVLLTF